MRSLPALAVFLIVGAALTITALAAPSPQQTQPLAVIETQPRQLGPEAAPAAAAFDAENWPEAIRLYSDLASKHPDTPQYAMRLALSLHRAGRFEDAVIAHEKAAAFPRLRPVALFNAACAHARLNRPDAAIKSLNLALDAGFDNADSLREDDDLASLRTRDDFREVLRRVSQPLVPLTWETLDDRMNAEAAKGFSGALLVRRDGRVVLSKGYGLADRARKSPCTPDTVFGIGSTPIDFTKASILLLAQRSRLDLSAPITKFFPNVPPDKQSITVTQLMTGRSGLEDFLGLPTDPDPDHFFIDRDEAMRRIFASKLLFEPGAKAEHSHAAWGVLAAIVEIVSGQTYEDFITRNLLEPAGMHDTGPFGQPDPQHRAAIGYGERTDGEENSPPFWGPTSWLVKGSGGMVSTVVDMDRWLIALRDGRILNDDSQKKYFANSGGLLAGGDVFGFEILYSQGPGTYMVLITNAGERRPAFQRLGQELGQLVGAIQPPTPFILGVQFQPHDKGAQVVGVTEGSPAQAAGLLTGDIVTAVNGQPVAADIRAVLRPHLQAATPIRLDLIRGAEAHTISITPAPRP